jgi:ABC-type glutathione transport system ATPase component
MTALLVIDDLVKEFSVAGQRMHALNGVSLSLAVGEMLAVVGESGSGKSILARVALRLERPTRGSARFEGREIAGLPERALRALRAACRWCFRTRGARSIRA